MSKLPPLKHYLPIPDNGYNNKYNHIPQWPFRLLICGSSGSGKTNLLLNLILQYLSYDRLLVYAKDLSEPKYEYLQELFNNDDDDDDEDDEEEVLFSSDDKVISVDELDPNKQNLIVFDDYITSRDQNKIEDLFIRGRKKNVSIIYLTQSYYQTPKNIRLQCNYLILFRSCNQREVNTILRDHTLDSKTVRENYSQAVRQPYNFFMFDFKNSKLKYRHNFNPIEKKRKRNLKNENEKRKNENYSYQRNLDYI